MEKISELEFIKLIGASEADFKTYMPEVVLPEFSFEPLSGVERDEAILSVIKKIDSPDLSVSGPHAKERWERGWSENLREFKESGCDISRLIPKYIRPGAILRLNRDYIRPQSSTFEYDYFCLLRDFLCRKYFAESSAVYEFGCGPGLNLVPLAEYYPKKEFHGLDWVSAPKEILGLLKQKYGYPIEGHIFDMFAPGAGVQMKPGSALLSIGALEQLGTNFGPFLEYMLSQKPQIVVHINHFTELYEDKNLLDYLAIKFERKRNYLFGFLPRLEELQAEGKIEILAVNRSFFGSLYHDGYSYVVWKPR